MAEPGSKSQWGSFRLPIPQAPLPTLKAPLSTWPLITAAQWLGKEELKFKQPNQSMHSALGSKLSLELTRKWRLNLYILGLLYNLSTIVHFPLIFSSREKIINPGEKYGAKLTFTIIIRFDFQKPVLLIIKNDVLLQRDTHAIALHNSVKH